MPGSGAPRLADVFLTWRERLLLYGDYCSNLTHAQDTLKTLEARDPVFCEQLAVSVDLVAAAVVTALAAVYLCRRYVSGDGISLAAVCLWLRYIFGRGVSDNGIAQAAVLLK